MKSIIRIATVAVVASCTPLHSTLTPLSPAKAKKLAEYTVLIKLIEDAFEEDITRIEKADTSLTKPTVRELRYATSFVWYLSSLKPLYEKRKVLREQYYVVLQKMITKITLAHKHKKISAFRASLASDADFAMLKELQKDVLKYCYEDILTIL